MEEYDVVIIGAGPAGMTAGIYSARAGKKTIIIEKGVVGGQVAWASNIENYPGFEKITGMELAKKMLDQAKKQGAEIKQASVSKIENKGNEKIVFTDEGEIKCKAVILAVGRTAGKLNIPGGKEFEGKGIHYCALCDAPLYKGKKMAVIGGGDSAIKEAIHLTELAEKVYVIHRRDELRAEEANQERLQKKKNVELVLDSEVKEFIGDKFLKKIKILNHKTQKISELEVSAVFIYIGHIPSTEEFDVEKNEKGFIKVNKQLETNVPGIFAAGDCNEGDIAQISTAVGDGAIAGTSATKYIETLK